MGELVVTPTRKEHAEQLAALQRTVFPTLADDERFTAEHYRHHVELFPDGQFVVLDGARVAGSTTTLRLDFDFAHADHRFADIFAGGWLTPHDPHGRWLYGADVGTHPDYRRRGVARMLYRARHATVRALGLAGQVTVGSPSGYGAVKDAMSMATYYAELLAGTRTDPTLSAQLRIGFEPRGVIAGYLTDPICDGYGVVLVLPAERDIAGGVAGGGP